MQPARFTRSLRSFFIRPFPSPAPSSRQPFGGKSQSHLIAGRGLCLGGPMRVVRFFVSVSFSSLLSISVAAQQTAPSHTQGLQLLQQSLSALVTNQTRTDVTLSGTARRIAGSDDESGTAVLKGLSSGAGRTDLSLSTGQRSEVQNLTGTELAGAWSGPDRISHLIAYHNLLSESAWFFPAFAIRAHAPSLQAETHRVCSWTIWRR